MRGYRRADHGRKEGSLARSADDRHLHRAGLRDLYEAFWRPEAFPRWASGLRAAALRREGDVWRADGPDGPIRIRFTAHNPFGIMDHWVETGRGADIHVPLRIVANGAGAEILLTLFRQPGMSDKVFARDADWVARDLATLRSVALAEL